MKKLFFLLSFLLFPLLAKAQDEAFPNLGVQEFALFLQSHPGVQLLDVRTIDEYVEGHLKNCILIDWKRDDFTAIALKVLQKNVPVALYCRGGGRGRQAAQKLLDEGFQKVVNLDKGYNSWKEAAMEIQY